jgi:mevalonate kinase
MDTFFSHGKLLITGEYAVLDGALSLAVPTKLGQRMEVAFEESAESNTLTWYSIDSDGETWYREEFLLLPEQDGVKIETYKMSVCNSNTVSDKLCEILNKASELNTNFLQDGSYVVKTYLDFPSDWGLGSSSTIICNIAKWAQVDAFELSAASFGGSGVDIAVGMLGGDVLYRSPELWEGFVYQPPFADQLFLVHLNQKQNSREGIATYKEKPIDKNLISEISNLTEWLIKTDDIETFQELIDKHEQLISTHINMPTVKKKYFNDYPYSVKSLGAWGGDFVLACGDEKSREYFTQKGFETVLPYKELIK